MKKKQKDVNFTVFYEKYLDDNNRIDEADFEDQLPEIEDLLKSAQPTQTQVARIGDLHRKYEEYSDNAEQYENESLGELMNLFKDDNEQEPYAIQNQDINSLLFEHFEEENEWSATERNQRKGLSIYMADEPEDEESSSITQSEISSIIKDVIDRSETANDEKKPSVSHTHAVDVANDMAMRLNIRVFDGQLYAFENPGYEAFIAEKMIARMKTLAPLELARMNSGFWMEVVKHLRTSESLFVDFDAVYYDPKEVIFKNGAYNIYTGKMRTVGPDELITVFNDVVFDPEDSDSGFYTKQFVNSFSGGNKQIKKLFWTVIGAMLSQTTAFKKFFLFWGVPNSGKSVAGDILREIIGPRMISEISIEDIARNFSVAQMAGKKLNMSMDISACKLKNLGNLKKLTGGGRDYIETDAKYGMFRKISTKHIKLLFASNSPIRIDPNEDPDSIRERMIVVPFMCPAEHKDPDLVEKLLSEKNYIIRKAMDAYRDLLENNYEFPYCEEANAIMDSFFCTGGLDSSITEFLSSGGCRFDINAKTACQAAYNAYVGFCGETGQPPVSHNTFVRSIKTDRRIRPTKMDWNGRRINGLIGLSVDN